jgi:hypothetical protein
MGIVYRARHVRLKRLVALKKILAGAWADEEDRARFRVEAEAVARLQHPNIVQIFEVGEHRGQPFCALEYVGGGTLADRLAGTLQPARPAASLVRTLALAMDAAHRRGIVHRDLKPANILLAEDGSPKVADFGLAKRLDQETAQTLTGAVLGTPAYMAPEQAAGQKEVGPAADVYALGAILYEMLTGRPPFRGVTVLDTLEQVRTREPVPPRRLQAQVPRDLETICLKCLEKQPRRRYASAAELADRLQLFLDGKPIPDRPRGWLSQAWRALRAHPWLVAVGVLLVLAVAAALILPPYLDPERPRKEVNATLARGQPYRLGDAQPLPGPFRQVYGDAAPPVRTPQGNWFSVESLGVALWELTDQPSCSHYRFSADVRHDGSGGASQVGIYFGFRQIQPTGGPRRGGFYTLSFADRGGLTALNRDGSATSRVQLQSRLFEVRPVTYVPNGPISAKPFNPALPLAGPGPERRLQVTVTPEGVEAAWEREPGKLEPIASVSAARLREALDDLSRSIQELRDVPTDYHPQFGLGLYVLGGKASFRNVTLEPLRSGG